MKYRLADLKCNVLNVRTPLVLLRNRKTRDRVTQTVGQKNIREEEQILYQSGKSYLSYHLMHP
jgi:hypothetical protein